jgi:hypothetical protein
LGFAGLSIGGLVQDLNLNRDYACVFHLQFIGRAAGQINFPSSDIRTAIIDFYFDLPSVLEVFDFGG